LIGGELHPGIRFERADKGPNSVATGGALMRERFIGSAPSKKSGVREAEGLSLSNQNARNSCVLFRCCRVILAIPTEYRTLPKII
jgi:hypothetical protein